MISGSVAVEGGAARPFPGGGSEFLRPLPRAPPYARAPPPALTLPGPDSDVPSTAPAYPPVPGAYARFLPHFYPYHAYQIPQPPSPLPLPPTHHQTQLHQSQLQQSQLQQSQLQSQRESLQLQRERESLLQRDRDAIQLQREREAAALAAAHQAAKSPLQPPIAPPPPPSPPTRSAPRGKEGSLKHRLLSRERTTPMGRFTRGALIQLGGGQLKRVEDMRTEDFVMSAERSPEVRLVDSTVVRLVRRPATDSVTLTLSYNGNTAQVDMDSPVEHPFFVYGHGWASCSPERTMQCYGLQVNRLQVGDVCVTLVPREPPSPIHPPPPPPPAHLHSSQTIVTTATTTAMTIRPTEAPQRYPENLSLREDSRKRRSSAPDVVGDDIRPRTMPRH